MKIVHYKVLKMTGIELTTHLTEVYRQLGDMVSPKNYTTIDWDFANAVSEEIMRRQQKEVEALRTASEIN